MSNLGKNPRIYSLRSIRQGATTKADATDMPEVFLRASGGWKGRALERYRKDRLPEVQEVFAARLGNEGGREGDNHEQYTHGVGHTPTMACSAKPGRVGVHPGESHPRHTLHLPTRNCGGLEEGKLSLSHYR